jgi:Transglutaminase-like superfamily
MQRTRYILLMLRALWELARYDLVRVTRGFQRLYQGLEQQKIASSATRHVPEALVCDAVCLASCFYWKPVVCLQRSVVAARLLKKYGIAAQLVIGYRPSPFFSHAWVEVDGRVVNDSPGYKQRLQVLSRV